MTVVAAEPLRRWAPWLLLAGVMLAYANSVKAPFLFDDLGAVQSNPTIRELFSPAVLAPPLDGSTTTGRPVTNLSFALNYALSGLRPWSYHALNVAIHGLAALALMGIVRRTLLRSKLQDVGAAAGGGPDAARESTRVTLPAQTSPRGRDLAQASAVGFFSALLWALHPLQTETVVCIAQRTESLCALFYLLALYGFCRGTERAEPGRAAPPRAWLALSVTACFLGMGTKEVMVTAPVVILLYDRTFGAGTFRAAWRRRKGYYLAVGVTWLFLLALLVRGGGGRGAAAGFGLGMSWWTYLLKQSEAILLYIKLAMWPHPLVLDYGTGIVPALADVAGPALLVLALLVVVVWALAYRPRAGFLAGCFFLILGPSSSIVPLVTQTVAEHRMYLPLAAIAVGVALGLFRGWARGAPWVLGAGALVCGALTIARNEVYRSAVSIWSDTVEKVPSNPRAHNNLALAWQEAGNTERANFHYARAVELQPDYVSAHYNWGVGLLGAGRGAEAVEQFATAVRLAPDHVDARVNLGNALMKTQRAPEAIAQFEAALRLQPGADVYYNLGVALAEAGRVEEAALHLSRARQLDPRVADANYQLGRLAERAGRADEAAALYTQTLRDNPDHVEAHARLGLLLARRERLAEATEHFRAVIRLRPGDADGQANLGNTLLLQSLPREALIHYEEALRLRPGDPGLRENIQLAREALR